MKKTTILKNVKAEKRFLGKSTKTSGNKYMITLKHNDQVVRFHFHDNYRNESTKKDFIYSLMLDAQAFDDNVNYLDFAACFGYDDIKEAKKIYDQCNKQYNRFNLLFNEEEQNELIKLFQNY